MSQTIDSRVVQMQFDNQQFESNAAQSMGTIKNLDKALKGIDGAQAFANISRAAGSVDLSNISSSVQALQERFRVLGEYTHGVLLGMVNTAVNAGKQIANALVFNPAKTGFAEYELQNKSVQRILANTKSKGEDIQSVNTALDELNEYADLTIYNFGQMTDNIGRFTAAGVGLKDSVTAIKGLSNAAALLGADSMAASRAGYQLSQALASGTIKLMDWNSMVNASMGGEKMQEAIMRVARHHGVAIDAMIEKEGSFRDTLSQGWLTSDIMLEALSHFTMLNDEASRSALEAAGYTKEEIDAIVELGETATQSATDVLGFSQLMDTIGEGLGSVWAQTWRAIMGDYEEAKTTFTAIKDEITELTDAWAAWQTGLVEGWADLGGREDLFQSLFNAFDALKSVLGPIGKAFLDVFPPVTSEQLANLTRKLREFTESLILDEKQMESLRRTATTVFNAIKSVMTPIVKVAGMLAKGIGSGIKMAIEGAAKAIPALIKGVSGLYIAGKPVSAWVKDIDKSINNLIDRVPGFVENVSRMAREGTLYKNIYESMPPVIQHLMDLSDKAFRDFTSNFEGMGEELYNAKGLMEGFDIIVNHLPDSLKRIATPIQSFFKNVQTGWNAFTDGMEKYNTVSAGMAQWMDTLQPKWKKFFEPMYTSLYKAERAFRNYRDELMGTNSLQEAFVLTLSKMPKRFQQMLAVMGDFADVAKVSFSSIFKDASLALEEFTLNGLPYFKDFVSGARTLFFGFAGDVVDAILSISDSLLTFVTSAPASVDELMVALGSLKDNLKANFTGLFDDLKATYATFWDNAPEGFKTFVNEVSTLATSLSDTVKKNVGNLTSWIEPVVTSIARLFGDDASALISKWFDSFDLSGLGERLKEGIRKALTNFPEFVKDVINSFKGVGDGVGDSIADEITSGLKSIPAKLSNVGEEAVAKVKKTFDRVKDIGPEMKPQIDTLVSTVGTGFKNVGESAKKNLTKQFDETVDAVKVAVPKIGRAAQVGLKKVPETVKTVSDGIISFNKILVETFETGGIRGALESLGNAFESFFEMLTGLDFESVVGKIKAAFDWFVNGGFQQIITALLSFDLHKVLRKYEKNMGSFSRIGMRLADAVHGLLNPIEHLTMSVLNFAKKENVVKKFNKMLGSIANKNNAQALRDVAISVAIFAGSIWLLSSIPWDQMQTGLKGFAAAVAAMIAALAVLSKFANSGGGPFDFLTIDKKGLRLKKAQSADMIGMAVAIVAFAGAVLMIAGALKSLSEIKSGLETGIIALTACLVALVTAMTVLGSLNKVVGLRTSAALLAIGLCVKLLGTVLADLGKLNPSQAQQGIESLMQVMLMLAACLLAMSQMHNLSLRTGVVILAIAGVLALLAPVIEKLGSMNASQAEQGVKSITKVMLALAVCLAACAGLRKTGLTAAAALGTMVFTIRQIGDTIAAIVAIGDIKAAKEAANQLTQILLVLGVMMRLSGTIYGYGAAASIAAVGVFIKLYGETIDELVRVAAKNPMEAALSLLAVAGIIAEVMLLTNKMPNNNNFGGVMSILAMAVAINGLVKPLKALSNIPWDKMQVGLAGLGVSLMLMTGAVRAFDNVDNGVKNIRSVATAFLILSIGIDALSAANPLTLALNLGMLAVAMGAFTKVLAAITPIIPSLKSIGTGFLLMASSVAVLGVGLTLVGAGLSALGAGIVAFAGLFVAQSAIIIQGIEMMLNSFVQLAPSITNALVALVAIVCQTLVGSADQIAVAIYEFLLNGLKRFREYLPQFTEEIAMIFVDGMNAITEYAPQIADAFFNMFIAVFDSLIPRTPELMVKVREFLDVLFGEIKDMVKDISLQDVEQVGALILGVIGVLTIIGKIHGIALAALKGLGVVSLVLVAIGAVLAGFGELAKIPGINDLVASGGELLSKIGYAIGDFVGSIIGGLGAGATSGLPEIGTNLSTFSTNVTPFVNYMKSDGTNLLTSIGKVTEASIKIKEVKDVKADKLVKFANSLNEFATPFKEFCNTMDGINTDAVNTAALAAKRLAEMVQILSESGGGLEGLISGNGVSLEDFGKQLEPFGKALKTASESFADVKGEAILNALPAAEALADLAGSMYRTGGAWQKFVGEHLSLDNFGTQVDSFATALKTASESFEGVKVGAIEAALPAATALADLAGEMVRFGGVWQKIVGEKTTLSGFGAQIASFGTGLAEASGSFELVKVDAIMNAVPAAQALAELAAAMQSNGGVESWFSGDKETLSSFGEDLTSFASSFVSFGNLMSTLPDNVSSKTITIVDALSSLASIKEKVTDLGTLKEGINRIADMKDNFTSFGDAVTAFSDSVSGINAGAVQNAQLAVECIVAIANGLPSQEDIDAIPDLSGLQAKFENMAESIKTFGDSLEGLDPSQIINATQAFDEIITLVNRINSINVSSFSGLADAFTNAAQNAVDGFKNTISGANVSYVVESFFASARNAALANGASLTSNFVKPVQDANQNVRNMASQFSATARALMEALGQGASGNKTVVMTAFVSAVLAAKTAVSGQTTTFYRTGADLVQGLINGINSKRQAAINAGTSLGNAVSNATRSATKVGSPSKVFFAIGKFLDMGLANGIIQNAYMAENASRETARGTIDAMQDELDIGSPSKVAKDEVGHWIVEGIADGIEEDTSAEEAAEKKAENIVNAFQEALDKIDLEFKTKDLDRKILDLMDVNEVGTRDREIERYLDKVEQAQKAYEYKKGAYDTIVEQGLVGTDKEIEARNAMKEAYVALLEARQEYDKYVLSSENKYNIADLQNENMQKELEIWKLSHPNATGAELNKKEKELLNAQAQLAQDKAADAYSYYLAAIEVYGETDKRTLEAYSQFLEAQKEYASLFEKTSKQTEETQKTSRDYLVEFNEFWKGFKDQAEAMGYTIQEIAKVWSQSNGGYNPVTFTWETDRDMDLEAIKKQGSEAERVQKIINQLKLAGPAVADGLKVINEGTETALTSCAEMVDIGMSTIGASGVVTMCSAMSDSTSLITQTGEQILMSAPGQVLESSKPVWIDTGHQFMQLLTDGVRSGESEFVESVNQAVNKAVATARAAMKSLGGYSGIASRTERSSTYQNSAPIPVISFDNVTSELRNTNEILGSFSFDKLNDTISSIQNSKPGAIIGEGTVEAMGSTNYSFTQNNYSPKALSNAEIYRQTKNQFAVFARKKG